MKWALLVFVFISLAGCQRDLCDVSGEQEHSLNLSSIGIANPDKPLDARKVNELKFFHNYLYIGQGDYAINTGPTDVIYYDPAQKTFVKEFTVEDEAILTYREVAGKLMIPGTDATESWDYGNLYVLNHDGWKKHRTIPRGIHVIDVADYEDELFVSTGLSIKSLGGHMPPGGVFRSNDGGESWNLSWLTPGDEMACTRAASMVVYKDKLYVFPYSYSGFEKLDEFPADYREFQGKPFGGAYLFYKWDFCGSSDAAVYDSKSGWWMIDLIPDSAVCKVEAIVFQDGLVMSAFLGEYVPTFNGRFYDSNGKVGKNARRALYVYDGERTSRVDIAYDMLVDKVVQADQLFLLVYRNDRYEILETGDLKRWQVYVLPEIKSQPMSLEYDRRAFYIGTSDGNIFRSDEIMTP